MNISTVTETLELYKLLQYDEASKGLFQIISEIIDSFDDGKLDINNIVNAISARSPEELADLVKQAQLILDQTKRVTTSLSAK